MLKYAFHAFLRTQRTAFVPLPNLDQYPLIFYIGFIYNRAASWPPFHSAERFHVAAEHSIRSARNLPHPQRTHAGRRPFEGDRDHLHPNSNLPWRISPEPFWLSADELRELRELGTALHQFYRAANLLYHQSVKGLQPAWVHQYLDRGKPGDVLEMGLWNRIKSHLPLVMRPDLLMTEDGFRIMEMDSVPGGMGFTAQVSSLYADLGYDIIGGPRGLVDGFYKAIAAATNSERPTVGLVVSDESEAYRDEMQWLADELSAQGQPTYCTHPRDLHFDEEGLSLAVNGQKQRLEAVYRFFELFDLKNIPKAELITYFAKKNAVRLTPPPRPISKKRCGSPVSPSTPDSVLAPRAKRATSTSCWPV